MSEPADPFKSASDAAKRFEEMIKPVKGFERLSELVNPKIDASSIARAFDPPKDVMDFALRPPPAVLAANENLASAFHKRLSEWIKRFDASLDNEHEVGVRLVSFGQAVTFHLDALGYWNPSLISFRGRLEDGSPVELIQHVSQISILLMTAKRQDPTQPKRPIGFITPDDASPADPHTAT